MAKKVLVADDSLTIQKVIELTFPEENYQILAFGNGRDALNHLREDRPDILLADVIMPELDGYELCREAKALQPGLPVILLTGTFEPFDKMKAEAAGYDDVVVKPFDSTALIGKVEALLSAVPPASALGAPAPEAAQQASAAGPPISTFETPLSPPPPFMTPEPPAADIFSSEPVFEEASPLPPPPAEEFAPPLEEPLSAPPENVPPPPPAPELLVAPPVEEVLSREEPSAAPPPLPAAAVALETAPPLAGVPAEPPAEPVPAEAEAPPPAEEPAPPTQSDSMGFYSAEGFFTPAAKPEIPAPAVPEPDLFAPAPPPESPMDRTWPEGPPATEPDREEPREFSPAPQATPSQGAAITEESVPLPSPIARPTGIPVAGVFDSQNEMIPEFPTAPPTPLEAPAAESAALAGAGATPPADQTAEPELAEERRPTTEPGAVPLLSALAGPPLKPVPEPEPVPVPAPAPEPVSAAGMTLNPAQMEALADAVVKKMSAEVIEKIAWEVVPELAEMLLRKRIKEIEESEGKG